MLNAGNLAPSASAGGPYAINEGDGLALNGSGTDSEGDGLSYSWDINGDGTNGDALGSAPSLTWAQLQALGITDNGNFTVKVAVDDGHGHVVTATAALTVANVAPTLSLSGPASVNEAAPYTLNLLSSDSGADTITKWTINWGDGTIEDVPGNPATATHTYADGLNNYTISTTATDEDGTFAAGNTVAVTVNDVAPNLTIGGNATVNEGALYTLNLSSSDVGPDTISRWTINWGDGNIQIVNGNPSSATHVYMVPPITCTISATATDEDNTFTAGNQVTVSVKHVVPPASISGPASVNEGEVYTLTLSANPAMNHPISKWTIVWGDGTQPTVVTGNPTSVKHTYAVGPNDYIISATASDNTGTFPANNTVAVTVNHPGPALTITGPAAVNEGVLYTLKLAGKGSGGRAIAGWTINWGDGTANTEVTGNPASVTHTYASGPNTYQITPSATDDMGAVSNSNGVSVAVKHVAPRLVLSGPTSFPPGQPYQLTLTGTPSGNHPLVQVTITWGDGSAPQVVPVSAGQTVVPHQFNSQGTFTIRATVTDDTGTFVATNTLVANLHPHSPGLQLRSTGVNGGDFQG